MANELIEAIGLLARDKNISKASIIEAIENALITAYKNQYNRRKDDELLAAENVFAKVDEESGEFYVFAEKKVVEEVEDPLLEISYEIAREIYPTCEVGDTIRLAPESSEFGRIATQNAKNVLLQNLRESEKNRTFEEFQAREKDVMVGVVHRIIDGNAIVNLGKADGYLAVKEQMEGERFHVNERIKVYVVEVKNAKKSLRILLSRTHPELVRKLFEQEVTEIGDGTVEILAIAREAGSRSKIAVRSNDGDVDAVGACVGVNGMRVNNVVSELKGEKIDIVNWSENPAQFIENALSPAKVVSVIADEEEKTATVIVPDYQLSLAIGKEGQNARLAAHLTGYKIDILNETQAAELVNEAGNVSLEEENAEEHAIESAGGEPSEEEAAAEALSETEDVLEESIEEEEEASEDE